MTDNNDDGWQIVRNNRKKKTKKNKDSDDPRLQNRFSSPSTASYQKMSHQYPQIQDFKDDVVFHKRHTSSKTQQHRGNRSSNEARHLAKIADETETFHHKRVNNKLSQQIREYRQNNKLSQKDLAAKMSLKLDIIQAYEKGTAIPDDKIVNSFYRIIRTPKKSN